MSEILNMKQWPAIANNYLEEREKDCFMSIFLDPEILKLCGNVKNKTIIDYGAGIGTLSRILANRGASEVISYEPVIFMRKNFRKNIIFRNYPNISLVGKKNKLNNLAGKCDILLCVNVVDHVKDIPRLFSLFNKLIKNNGHLVLSIPHPMKNWGTWEKEYKNNVWNYLYYKTTDYLKEDIVTRYRENKNGKLIIKNVISFHRTISNYLNNLIKAGFQIDYLGEPKPDKSVEKSFPALFQQSSRIPYFLTLKCSKV